MEISTWTIVKTVLVLLFFVFLYAIKSILIMLFLSLIIASAIYPFATKMATKKIPRAVSVLFVYLVAIFFVVLLLYMVVPTVVDEIRQFASVLPSYYDTLSEKFSRTILAISPDYTKTAQDFLINFGEKIKEFSSSVFSTVKAVFGGFATFGVVIVVSFYMAFQEKGVENFIRLVTPKHQEDYVLDLWKRVEKKLGLWLQGQLMLGLIVGFAVFLGLLMIKVPYALLLGIVAGIFEIVPVVGPIFSAILGISVAAIVDPVLGVLALLLYFIIQQVENHFLVPMLMKKMTGLNPIVIIASLLIGFELGGILGMVISVPVATIAGELLDDYAKAKADAEKQQTLS